MMAKKHQMVNTEIGMESYYRGIVGGNFEEI